MPTRNTASTVPSLPPRGTTHNPRLIGRVTIPGPVAGQNPANPQLAALVAAFAEYISTAAQGGAATAPTMPDAQIPQTPFRVPMPEPIAAPPAMSPTGGVDITRVREGLMLAPTRRGTPRVRAPRYFRRDPLTNAWVPCCKADVGSSTYSAARDMLASAIRTRLDQGAAEYVTKALRVLYERQIDVERATEWTVADNDKGFNKPDARRFSARAKAMVEGQPLTAAECQEFGPVLAKYAGQLARREIIGESV